MSDLKREPGTFSSLQVPASGSAPGHVELEGLSSMRPVCNTALPALPALNGRIIAGDASDDGIAGGRIAGAARKAGTVEDLLRTSGSDLAIAVPGPGAAPDDFGLPGPTPVEIARFPLPALTGDDGGLIEGSWRGEVAARVGRHCQRRWVARRTGMPFHPPLLRRTTRVVTVKTGEGRD